MIITLSILSLAILFFSYFYTAKKRIDNICLYAIYVYLGSFFLQATGFLYFDLQYKYIDTVQVSTVSEYLYMGAIQLFILSIIIGCLTIIFTNKDVYKTNHSNTIKYNIKNYYIPTCIVLALIIIGLSYFVFSEGKGILSLLEAPSKKIEASDSSSVDFESAGYYRLLTQLGGPLFLVFVAYKFYYNQKFNNILYLALLMTIALIPPYLLSARGSALYIFISIFYMLVVLRKVTISKLIFGGIFVVIAFSALTASRFGDDDTGIGYAIENRVFYGGGVSLFNTTIITKEYIENSNELKYGASYLGLLTAPIPRSIWQEKPSFAYDQYIARSIYKISGFGAQAIPAGIIGESIINFGIYFSWLIIAIFFYILIEIQNLMIRINNKFYLFILRTIVFPKFVMKIFASGIGFAIMDSILLLISISLILSLISQKNKE